jgi:hypothetical protein
MSVSFVNEFDLHGRHFVLLVVWCILYGSIYLVLFVSIEVYGIYSEIIFRIPGLIFRNEYDINEWVIISFPLASLVSPRFPLFPLVSPRFAR